MWRGVTVAFCNIVPPARSTLALPTRSTKPSQKLDMFTSRNQYFCDTDGRRDVRITSIASCRYGIHVLAVQWMLQHTIHLLTAAAPCLLVDWGQWDFLVPMHILPGPTHLVGRLSTTPSSTLLKKVWCQPGALRNFLYLELRAPPTSRC
jgi:hypothetical protein